MERPLERRTAVRTAVVWEAISSRLGDAPVRVVDVGGGTGGLAVRLAEMGHRVSVVDPSPDALAALSRRAQERGVEVTGLQGDLDDVPGLVADGSLAAEADLVLCHGVLGILADPHDGLDTIAGLLRPGGALSLLVGNRHAAVLTRAMAGHFRQALASLDGDDEGGERRFTTEELADLLGHAYSGWEFQAVRVFADLVPGTLLDLEAGASAALLDLERAVSTRPEYLTLAAQLHVLATR